MNFSNIFRVKTLVAVLEHLYIWIWLVLFALPFVATALHSFEAPGGGYSTIAYSDALGSFKDSLILSVELTLLAILINLLISLPAAFAIVRHEIPGKRSILVRSEPFALYAGSGHGASLAITYAYLLGIPRTREGLVAAYVVGTFPLMLVPIIVALRDQPLVYGEAARTLGANRLRTFVRIELPLLGPGISAGVLMSFVIVFNEFLVTLFIAGPETQTAALRVYNLTRTAGFAPSTAALATIMQATSFIVVLLFFKLFSQRYLKGTYFT